MLDRLHQQWIRLSAYPIEELIVEFILIWVAVFLVFRFLRGTRGARVLKGFGLILLLATAMVAFLSRDEASFQRLRFLYGNFLTFATVALVIVFQPELRRALMRLGEAKFFQSTRGQLEPTIRELLDAVSYLSRNKIGALIAIERDVGLGAIVEAGTPLNAHVTSALLKTIFWPGTALHDLGVVIRGNLIRAAGVPFPMAEGEQIAQELGSRHRAALGLSEEADCLIIVVSEETGTISFAERGHLMRKLSIESLEELLHRGLKTADVEPTFESPQQAREMGAAAPVADEPKVESKTTPATADKRS